ncbi:hypothetical protein [Neobacillus sp. D3-1R]|uniref:hypothetical protein n=1 Tax=Neobacillus sp. D3-1R TaxID=3445778 RepID=UPI003FA03C18
MIVTAESRQKIGGIFSIIAAILSVLVMVLYQVVAMRGVTGSDVYETTVHSMAAHPIANWALMMTGLLAFMLFFWTVEALDERFRTFFPTLTTNFSRFAYFFLLLYCLYLLLPAAVLHDIANSDLTISEALETVHPIVEISLVLSSLSSLFLGVWLIIIGMLVLRSNLFSKLFGIFTLFIGAVVIFSGAYEALYGRGSIIGIAFSILSFVGAFVVWKIWLGILLLRKPL